MCWPSGTWFPSSEALLHKTNNSGINQMWKEGDEEEGKGERHVWVQTALHAIGT